MKRFLIVAFVVLPTGSAARAEHILLPIFVNHVAGAGGSSWSAEVSVHNPSDADVVLNQSCPYLSPCPAGSTAPANSTAKPFPAVLPSYSQHPGYDLLVDDFAVEMLSLQLRVFAESPVHR